MAFTYFGSALRSGSSALTDATDGGYVMLCKTGTVTTNADGTASSVTITLPPYAQITNFNVDMVQNETVGGGTATAIALTAGTAAAGTQYMSSTDGIGGGRISPTFTAAQLLAMSNIGTNTSFVLTADPNGTISTTQGIYRVNVLYFQTV